MLDSIVYGHLASGHSGGHGLLMSDEHCRFIEFAAAGQGTVMAVIACADLWWPRRDGVGSLGIGS